jgi:membrane fusion protein (multidrug efflux system)
MSALASMPGFAAGMLLALALASCRPGREGGGAPPPRPPAGVKTAVVGPEDYAWPLRVVGTVIAEESSDLSANVTETVSELHFDDGDQVRQGQLLARLGDAEEEALLASARAVLAEEEREAERLAGLVAEGAAAEARLAERRTSVDIARQRILEAEARIADRRIVAPFDGRVGLRRISPGALVRPGTVIATIDKVDVVKIEFAVPETVLGTVGPGTGIVATTEAARDRTFPGQVETLDSRIDSLTRSVLARARVPNPDLALRPGQLAMVELRLEPRRSLSVPERALVPAGAKQQVFVVHGDGEAARVRLTEIRVGRRKPGQVEVTDGLRAGDRVVTDGLVGLLDGAPVRLAGEYQGPVPALNPERAGAVPAPETTP